MTIAFNHGFVGSPNENYRSTDAIPINISRIVTASTMTQIVYVNSHSPCMLKAAVGEYNSIEWNRIEWNRIEWNRRE